MLHRVRIALAMNSYGQWAAYGRWDTDDETALTEATGNVSDSCPSAAYFVDVELPVPRPVDVAAAATPKETPPCT